MNKTNKHSILIIIVSAILVAVLFNIRFIFFILDQLETKRFSDMVEREKFKVLLGAFDFVFYIILFCLIAFFNYSWKDKLIHPGMSKTGRVLLIIIANILIFYAFAFSESALVREYNARWGMRLTTGYFFLQIFQ